MPDHKLHRNFNILLLCPLTIGILFYYLAVDPKLLAILAVAFVYATFFAHPDLDLANQIKLFSLTGFFTLPFRIFYAPFIKHRSKISHSLIWGTPSRILAVILFALLVTFLYLCYQKIGSTGLHKNDLGSIWQKVLGIARTASQQSWKLAILHQTEILFAIGGFYLADLGHLLLDKLK